MIYDDVVYVDGHTYMSEAPPSKCRFFKVHLDMLIIVKGGIYNNATTPNK